jgi:RND family efflux transporter MFP subunit
MKRPAVLSLLAVAAAGALWWWLAPSAGPAPGGPESAASRLVAKAERRDIESAVVASGFVRPVVSSEIKAEVSGKIAKIHVEAGQAVRKDDLLVDLDPTLARADRDESARNVQLQRLNVEKLARDRSRTEALRAREFVSAKEMEDAVTAHEVAKLQLEVAQSRLEKAEENLRKVSIRAPHDGVVSDLGVLEGQIAVGAQSINSGTLLMKVSAVDPLRVDINLNEFDATRIELGRDAVLTFDSMPGVRREGKVTFLAPFGTADAKDKEVRVFPCQIGFGSGGGVRPGISANARILLATAKGVVAVPVSAVFIEETGRFVFVRGSRGEWQRRAIEAGLSDAGWTEVTKGLAEGEVVSLVRPAGLR